LIPVVNSCEHGKWTFGFHNIQGIFD
jgi:hypothetical protein